jgi:hypothetical protein
MDNVWDFLRANFLSHQVWDTYEAILDACRNAWNKRLCRKFPNYAEQVTGIDAGLFRQRIDLLRWTQLASRP